jgi:hypothetical protein
MLTTRFLFAVSSLLICTLNVAALWQVLSSYEPVPSLAAAALVVNAVTWPLAILVAYRIGQAANAEARLKARSKARHLAARI